MGHKEVGGPPILLEVAQALLVSSQKVRYGDREDPQSRGRVVDTESNVQADAADGETNHLVSTTFRNLGPA